MTADPAAGTEVKIGRLGHGELTLVHAIARQCFDLPYTMDVLQEYRRRAGSGFFVARSDGDLVGFSVTTAPALPWRLLLPVGEIVLIAVSPGHHRRGIGQRLLSTSFSHLERRGVKQVRLHVDVGNEPAIALYELNGMTKSHIVSGYYRNGRDAYRMIKRLR